MEINHRPPETPLISEHIRLGIQYKKKQRWRKGSFLFFGHFFPRPFFPRSFFPLPFFPNFFSTTIFAWYRILHGFTFKLYFIFPENVIIQKRVYCNILFIKYMPMLFNYLKIPECFIGWSTSFTKNWILNAENVS